MTNLKDESKQFADNGDWWADQEYFGARMQGQLEGRISGELYGPGEDNTGREVYKPSDYAKAFKDFHQASLEVVVHVQKFVDSIGEAGKAVKKMRRNIERKQLMKRDAQRRIGANLQYRPFHTYEMQIFREQLAASH